MIGDREAGGSPALTKEVERKVISMPKKIAPDRLTAVLMCEGECHNFTVHTYSRASVMNGKVAPEPEPEDDEEILSFGHGKHYALIFECGSCGHDRRYGTVFC